ncbi:Transmembrane emp24 domain-containing protein 10 [Porphyridium purpureum]|uniref:Transmembrane emp24 domain-containing protein 10 n=1 Tax=Porphyridium purpureum TaxID=35688 RepID=A0A5J4YY66_PORPP|nr:Transmembrane emp24 domain-containing protein 10 [Porphyridium purpureum]|eukprot:POR9374..scf209_3
MPVSAPRTFGKELRTEVELVVEHVVHTGNQYVVRGLEPLVLLNLSSGEPALFTFVADPVVADAAVQGAGNEWTDYTAPDEFADMRLYEQDLYYRLCVSLQVFRVRRKSGRTRVHAGDAELEGSAIPPRMVSLTLHTSVQGKDYQALAAKSHLGPLEIELQRLQDELKELSVQISVATERAERIRELNERTKRGVMLSSVIACAVLCVAGYLQTAYLRDFIKKAKLS